MEKWQAGVVVGVDGSDESSHALEWAAAAADRHGARLSVVSAFTLPTSVTGPGFSLAEARAEAEHAVERALAQLAGKRPGSRDVVGEVTPGGAAHVLVDRSRTSDLVVVGRRGLTGLDRVLLGSVSSALAAMAYGPVAVVPRRAPDVAPRRVVAAVDTDDQPGPVLELAFEEAAASGCALEVVHGVDPGLLAGALPGYATMPESWRDWALRAVSDDASRWAEKYPQVRYDVTVREGRPRDVLLEHLRPDDVVVVGGRRHSPVVGRMLGSVPDRLLRSAPCSVVIAHSQTGRSAASGADAVG